jgi:SulP family sulfate permease
MRKREKFENAYLSLPTSYRTTGASSLEMAMRLTFFAGLRPLNRGGAIRDAIAGLTLASMNIPQVLGYTRIAGTPAVTGLYTVLLPLLMFAIFGSSRHLVVAADSATAAIFSSGLSGMAPQASEKYMALVGMVALLTAALLLLARIFKLGFLADFLSRTVLVGFLTGVGFQIGIAMLGEMLGIPVTAHKTIVQLQQLIDSLLQVNLPTLAISGLVVCCILGARHYLPRLPVPLFAVLAGIAASYLYDFAGHGIAVIGPVPGGLPSLTFPTVSWDELLKLVPIALSCFVIIIAQSAATSRVFGVRHHERVDEDADILGLSAANAAAALSGLSWSTAVPHRLRWRISLARGARLHNLCSPESCCWCCCSLPVRYSICPAVCLPE